VPLPYTINQINDSAMILMLTLPGPPNTKKIFLEALSEAGSIFEDLSASVAFFCLWKKHILFQYQVQSKEYFSTSNRDATRMCHQVS
jgi:hypothetical protein